jgi:hypothetical protein
VSMHVLLKSSFQCLEKLVPFLRLYGPCGAFEDRLVVVSPAITVPAARVSRTPPIGRSTPS